MNTIQSHSPLVAGFVWVGLIAGWLGLGLSGCSDNPVTSEVEVEPVGLVIASDGDEVVRIEGFDVTGTIAVDEGTLSPHYTLKFLDQEGNLFVPDSDHTPSEIIGDSTVIAIERDEPSDWDFNLRGLKEGVATLRVVIIHGAHNDYVSPEIPVTIVKGGTLRHNESGAIQ